MDPLDFAIYRFLSRGGEARFWAGRRIVDPRITPREIAEQVGASESGVRARLRHLGERGFLRGRRVTPNPSLFGEEVFVAGVPVRQPREAARILKDLALVEGAVFARDLIDEDERRIQVYLAAESERVAQRRVQLVARLSASGKVTPLRSYFIPRHAGELSSLDWKVLEGVWRRPDTTIAELAEAVGIGLKSAARSYRSLLDRHACWWTHGPEAEEFPLAFVRADLHRPTDLEGVAAWVAGTGQSWMPVARDGFGTAPDEVPRVLAGLVPADAPTVLERFLHRLAEVDGVEEVHRTFPLGSASFPAWASEKIQGRTRSKS